ncbi:P-loop containing nucleoside triphosphate hydrolase protein [Xylogone sp. PMI_703]|nr:P-loop containing nucleoside triphosphate hydrolase protein [Xylogone sp. PMI_703]
MATISPGANALMLDLDFGTYLYVTSSDTGLGGIFTGLTLNPTKIDNIIGVVKAYTARVGGGPFPTELLDEDGKKPQEIGRDTQQPSITIPNSTLPSWTWLDTFTKIKIVTKYIDEETKEEFDSFPADLGRLAKLKPV